MNSLKYSSISVIYNILWFLIIIKIFTYAKLIEIKDSESFERELKNSKNYDVAEFVIKQNITLNHKIEIEYENYVNISITGFNSNINIDNDIQNIEGSENDENYILKLIGTVYVNIHNINFNGNVHFKDINYIELDSIFTTDAMKFDHCNFLINNSIFETSNKEIYLYIIKLENSTGIVRDTNFYGSTEVELIANSEKSQVTFENVNIKGSFDKFEKIPLIHGALRFKNSIVNLFNVEIENFGDLLNKGFMISMVDTIGKIENSFIHNGFSSGHEAISISVNSELVIQNSKINNIYSSGTISLISNDGILNIENTEIYNNLNITRYYNWKFNNAGSVITNSNNGRLETKNINIHDIITSTVFFIKNFSKTKATNVTMSNIEIYNYGAPFTTYDTTDAILDVENVYIKNIKQYGDKHGGLLIWLESYTEVTIKNCIIENGFSAHEKSRIVYFLAPDKCKLSLINSEFRNINLAHFLIVFDKGNYLGLDNLRFINCKSYSGIFLISNTSGEMEINNIYIDGFNKNMANMDFTTEILNVDYLDLIYGYLNISTIFFYGKNSALKINNLTIVNSSLYTGFVTTTDIDIKITNSKIDNNLIFNSFIYLDDYIRSKYNIFNTTFNSNIGMTGVIMQNRKSYYYDSELHYFEQCIFKNNRAIKNGGIIFSLVDVSDSIFKDCKFINNNAEAGSVSFTKKKIYEPKFIPDIYSDPDNILNNGLLYGGPFVTNPNRVLCNPIEPKFINSGDNINVNCSLLDEYDNKYNLLKDPETASILDVVFFKITIENRELSNYNKVKLKGKTHNYCAEECTLDNISVVGEEGDYYAYFEIVKFGNIFQFQSRTPMEFSINKCNETTHFKEVDSDYPEIKTCKKIECNCARHGKCIKNICECINGWKGDLCDINPIFVQIKWPIFLFSIIGFIELALTVVLIVLTIHFREYKEIKLGKPFFLVSILVGTISHLMMVFLGFSEPTKFSCIVNYWLRLMGNAFIYGSIIIKCYQISYIYYYKKLKVMSNRKALSYYYSIVIAHIIILLIWTFIDNENYVLSSELSEGQIYFYCGKPKTYLISIIFSLFFIIVGIHEVYKTRYIPKQLKEPLGLPLYAYSIYILIDIFITLFRDSYSPNFLNTIQCLSIIIFCPIVVYNLNFKKIFTIINDTVDSGKSYEKTYGENENSMNLYKTERKQDIYDKQFGISSIKYF